MGQINKIQALYYIKYTLISNYYFLLIWSILETRAKKCGKISLVFWSMGSHEKLLLGLTDLWKFYVEYFFHTLKEDSTAGYYDIFWENLQKFLFSPGLFDFHYFAKWSKVWIS